MARSLDYFKSSTVQAEVQEVILSGGCALIRDFASLLSRKIGIPVMLAQPFKNIVIPKKLDMTFVEEMAPLGAVAVGLAMRRPGDR